MENRKRTSWLQGFSLIELMVVISVIAILMALGAVSYTTAQKKSRDAARRTDMRAVQNGFEQYYTVNGGYAVTCANMATAEFLPGGLPSDPKPAPQPDYSYSCTASTYCACAQLENEVGNSDNANCAYDNSGDESHFCVTNQQ